MSGFTYQVESTTETYTIGTTGAGTNFAAKNGSYSGNVTWSVPVGSKISLNTNSGLSATFDVSSMTNTTQTILQSVITHTLRGNFADGYNDHIGSINGYNVNKDKTVYSVDSYDGNSTLCLTVDTPIELANGDIIEIGDVEEGMKLKGYSLNGLDSHDDSNYMDWNTSELNVKKKK